jgi:hypothetical protein
MLRLQIAIRLAGFPSIIDESVIDILRRKAVCHARPWWQYHHGLLYPLPWIPQGHLDRTQLGKLCGGRQDVQAQRTVREACFA